MPVAQTLGLTVAVQDGIVPSLHLLDPALVSKTTFLSTPDESLMIVVSFKASLAVVPSAHFVGGLVSAHVGIDPSEHLAGVPLAVPVLQVPAGLLSAHVGAKPLPHRAGPFWIYFS